MSENTQENTTPARPVKVKSNAPWVLGLLALLLAIPNLMCQMLCKEAVNKLDEVATEVGKASSDLNKVVSNVNRVAQSNATVLGGLTNTLDAASKGNLEGAAEAGKKSLDASVDTVKATAEVADEAAKQADKTDKAEQPKDAKESADSKKKGTKEAMEAFDSFMKGSFALCVVMFFLSLFGKSKLSAITGIAIVVGALVLAGWSMAWVQILGGLEGVLFLFSGIFSITNLKKVK